MSDSLIETWFVGTGGGDAFGTSCWQDQTLGRAGGTTTSSLTSRAPWQAAGLIGGDLVAGDVRCERVAERLARELLDAVEALLCEYVVIGDHQRAALCLWVLHTHTFAVTDGETRAASEVTPYIQVHSATPGCGKSLLFEVLEAVVREPWKSDGITKSVLVRKVHALCPTLLLDEIDRMMAGDKELRAALEAVLNSGYRRRGTYSMSALRRRAVTGRASTTACSDPRRSRGSAG